MTKRGEYRLKRQDKINYYLVIAQTVAKRCTCLRRSFRAIIVKNDSILSTGYVGSPRGRKNCSDLGYCTREQMLDTTLYLCGADPVTGELVAGTNSCVMCKRMILNAGITTVIVRDTAQDYRVINTDQWIEHDDSLIGQRGY